MSKTLLQDRRRRARLGSRRSGSPPGSTTSSATATSSRFRTTASRSSAGPWKATVEVAKRMGLPLVATSDAHYVEPRRRRGAGRAALHQHRQVPHRHEPDEDGGERVLPPLARRNVRGTSRAWKTPSARSQEIADTVDIDLELGKRHFPTSADSAGEDGRRLSCASCASQGLKERYADEPEMLTPERRARAGRDRPARSRAVRASTSSASPNYFLDRVGLRPLRRRERHPGHGAR